MCIRDRRLVKQASIEAAEMVDEDEQTKQATYESIRDRLATSQVRDAAIEQLLNMTGATREACGNRLDQCNGNVDDAAVLLLTDVAEAAPTKAATGKAKASEEEPDEDLKKALEASRLEDEMRRGGSVSYTHLTLPTKRIV